MSTRDVSSAQEKRIAKALGGKRTSNSGATKFDKGDIVLQEGWLIEAKTCMQPKKSFSIKQEWLKKNKEEMYATGKDVGNFTTANEVKVLEKSGMFDKAFAYTNSTVLKTGDILCTKTRGHTVVVVSGNPVDNRPVIKIGDKVTLTVNLKCYKGSNNKSGVWHIISKII